VRTKDGANQKQLLFALHKGEVIASIFVLVFSAIIVYLLFAGREDEGWNIYVCIVVGLLSGFYIGKITEYFTSNSYYPTRSIAHAGVTGPATVIIQGMGIGMISCVFPVLLIVTTILICNALAGEYGVAIAAVGMPSTLGLNVASDTYGAISDNAGGIAEMTGLDERVRVVTDTLDALGNTTAATGKGFAIGSAVLTALSLLAAFKIKAEINVVDIGDPIVLSGALSLLVFGLDHNLSSKGTLHSQFAGQRSWCYVLTPSDNLRLLMPLSSRCVVNSKRFRACAMELPIPIPIPIDASQSLPRVLSMR
jgi:K(+)-stimulated pyrophosphate-energized sodium pump